VLWFEFDPQNSCVGTLIPNTAVLGDGACYSLNLECPLKAWVKGLGPQLGGVGRW
jgi:hypothetical protein